MTTKQATAIKLITENHMPATRAMKKAGYKPSTYTKPANLTKSKTFIEILEKAGITDDKLAEVLNDGLGATKVIVMGKESKESFVDVVPDHPTRHKFLETSLRVKGHERDPVPNTVIIPIYGGLSARPDSVPLPRHNSHEEDFQIKEEN